LNMYIQSTVFVILSIMSAVAVYAAGVPVTKTDAKPSQEQHEPEQVKKDTSNSL
jgi:hypothetical protein